MVTIHPDGFILGGACHKGLNDRAGRERGAQLAWDDARDQDCVVCSHGWLRIVKDVKRRPFGQYGGGNAEIGFLRACHEIFSQLIKTKRKFRLKSMNNWIIDVARFELGISSPTPLGPISFMLIESNKRDDLLYEKGHAKSYVDEKIKQVMNMNG